MTVRSFVAVALSLCAPAAAQTRFTPTRKTAEIAPGVYTIQHPDALPDFPEGNTTVIVGDTSVFVVDSGYLPSTTRKDIAQIRQWTKKPVRYLMNTHGHTDHTTGNGIYAREFPGLTVVAHRETRRLMERYTPAYFDLFEQRVAHLKEVLASGTGDDGKPLTPDARKSLEADVQAREKIAPDLRTMGENALPDTTFDSGTLYFDLGNREVQVKFLGRGNTAGDAVAFLPKERIAIVGDILVAPVPYTCSGFPVDWISTLDNLAALQPAIIVPGHGESMHDLAYLHTMHDLLAAVVAQVDAAFHRIPGGGQSSLERMQKLVDVAAFRSKFPPGDQYNPDFFGRNVPNCLVRNVYYQLAPR